MANESPSAHLHSFSSSSSGQEESFLPKGNKLFGCMGIFFLFSGGFIGSFFALDALEEGEFTGYRRPTPMLPCVTSLLPTPSPSLTSS